MPALFALHGNLGTGGDWQALGIPGMVTPDLWDFVDLPLWEAAEKLCSLAPGGKPLLAGYSMGGRLALHCMALAPNQWGGAVIVSAHPGLESAEDRSTRLELDAEWARAARELPWREFVDQWNSQSTLAEPSPGSAARLGEQLALEPRREEIALAFQHWSLGHQENLRKQLADFNGRVLWITGAGDEKFMSLARSMSGTFRHFRHEIVSGCGHRVLQDAPAALSSIIHSLIRPEPGPSVF